MVDVTKWGRARTAAVLLAAFLAPAAPAHAQQGAHGLPEARAIRTAEIKGDIGSKDESASLSGMACATQTGSARRSCILVGDEEDLIWAVTLTDNRIQLDTRIHPAPGEYVPRGKNEFDLEAATFVPGAGGGAYYVTGSHGASRKDSLYEPKRYRVFRLPTDAAGAVATGRITFTRNLEKVIAAIPDLVRHACAEGKACISADDDEGLTIEGIAAHDGVLYFGLRNPTKAGATILKVSADALFSGDTSAAEPLRVQLDAGDGVRDIATVTGGFLILAGLGRSDDKLKERRSVIHFWDGTSTTTKPLAQIISKDKAKPEALLVLRDAGGGRPYEVLVLSDKEKKGTPTVYEVPAP